MPLKIELGKKNSATEAKAIVGELYGKVRDRWEVKVNQTPFMRQLATGRLSLKVLQTFFRNWGAYTIEINTLTACTYHKNITFFKVHRDLMAPMGEKIRGRGFFHSNAIGISRQNRFHAQHRLRGNGGGVVCRSYD
jgi:hypothetical protein